MKKSGEWDQDEAWFTCWDCHRNLGLQAQDNPPQSCKYCGSNAVVYTVPPDTQWVRVDKNKDT